MNSLEQIEKYKNKLSTISSIDSLEEPPEVEDSTANSIMNGMYKDKKKVLLAEHNGTDFDEAEEEYKKSQALEKFKSEIEEKLEALNAQHQAKIDMLDEEIESSVHEVEYTVSSPSANIRWGKKQKAKRGPGRKMYIDGKYRPFKQAMNDLGLLQHMAPASMVYRSLAYNVEGIELESTNEEMAQVLTEVTGHEIEIREG